MYLVRFFSGWYVGRYLIIGAISRYPFSFGCNPSEKRDSSIFPLGREQGWPCIAEQAVFLLGHRPDIPVDVFHPVLMFATGKDTHYFWIVAFGWRLRTAVIRNRRPSTMSSSVLELMLFVPIIRTTFCFVTVQFIVVDTPECVFDAVVTISQVLEIGGCHVFLPTFRTSAYRTGLVRLPRNA